MTKKNFSNKFYFLLWSFFHLAIIAAFAVSLFFTKGINFDADYTNMLPSTTSSKALQTAEKSISASTNSSVFILAGHKDFKMAKSAAEEAYSLLKNEKSKFEEIFLYSDYTTLEKIKDFLGKYRFNLLDKEFQQQILSPEGCSFLAEETLSSIFSGFSFSSLENIEEDPFFLDDKNTALYLSKISDAGTRMTAKDGVLASEYDGNWYVMIRGKLTEEGARLASKKNAVPLIYEKCLPLEKDGVSFVFYGTPFHSYKSSSSAYREISVISIVSLLTVTLLLYFVFRSTLPIALSVLSIILSIGISFMATHLIFGKIYMIALVFGTSLIGSSIDYSLHYFINWKAALQMENSTQIRRHISKGLVLSLVSTEICFILLMFAPFDLLKQMAVFCFTGILSSFLTVTGFFTRFSLPPVQKRHIPFLEKHNLSFSLSGKKPLAVSLILIALSAAILIPNSKKLSVQNDISNLYKMEGRIKEDTILATNILDYNPTSWLVIEGKTAEEVLQKEEELAPLIPDSFSSTSKFIPSSKKQLESIQTAKNLVPAAEEIFGFLGLDETAAENFKGQIENAGNNILTVQDSLPQEISSLTAPLWIGKVDGNYYSIILPSKISDENFYRNLADSTENVYFENKVKDVSAGLDKLTVQILIMFAISFLIIAVVLKFFYSWKETLKILSIPLISLLAILCTFVLAGLKIEFFCITGVILVFGLGLDYVIYRMENKENKLEAFAILLSFVTTSISFGALALSSFVPVHVMGLSIFTGLITAFILAMI